DHRTERLISVLDVRGGWGLIRQLKLPWEQGYVYPTAIEPQKRLIAVGWCSRVLLFDLDPPNDPLNAEILFGSDCRGAPMGWGQPVACYRVAGDQEGGRAEVRELWFSADGSYLKVLCNDGEAVLMSVSDGEVRQRTLPPPAEHDHRYSAQVSQAGRVAACG